MRRQVLRNAVAEAIGISHEPESMALASPQGLTALTADIWREYWPVTATRTFCKGTSANAGNAAASRCATALEMLLRV